MDEIHKFMPFLATNEFVLAAANIGALIAFVVLAARGITLAFRFVRVIWSESLLIALKRAKLIWLRRKIMGARSPSFMISTIVLISATLALSMAGSIVGILGDALDVLEGTGRSLLGPGIRKVIAVFFLVTTIVSFFLIVDYCSGVSQILMRHRKRRRLPGSIRHFSARP